MPGVAAAGEGQAFTALEELNRFLQTEPVLLKPVENGLLKFRADLLK